MLPFYIEKFLKLQCVIEPDEYYALQLSIKEFNIATSLLYSPILITRLFNTSIN